VNDRWRLTAGAIGDTNVFVVRDASLRLAFPIQRAASFGRFPSLISTNTGIDSGSWRWTNAVMDGRDTVIIATDAVAEHLMRCAEAGTPAWFDLLTATRTKSSFRKWVHDRRVQGMTDDDTTVMTIQSQ
jgi:hypothetical protein